MGTGAVDDGAGVVIATAAAKLIAGLPAHPRRTIRVVLFGAEEMDVSDEAYGNAHAAEAPHIAIAAEADAGARQVYMVQLPAGVAAGAFGRALEPALTPLGAYLDRQPAPYGGSDVSVLQKAGVPVASLRQDVSDYFDVHHTADDTLDKVDPRQLAQAVGAWAAFAYLAAESDLDFRAPPQAAAK